MEQHVDNASDERDHGNDNVTTRTSRESSTSSSIIMNHHDNKVIINAIEAIVKATSTQAEATIAIQLLEKELMKLFNNIEDDDHSHADDDGVDDATSQTDGRLVVERHKKTEGDKWRDLMVYYIISDPNKVRRRSKDQFGRTHSWREGEWMSQRRMPEGSWNLSNICPVHPRRKMR